MVLISINWTIFCLTCLLDAKFSKPLMLYYSQEKALSWCLGLTLLELGEGSTPRNYAKTVKYSPAISKVDSCALKYLDF